MAPKPPNKSTMPWGQTNAVCGLMLTGDKRLIVGKIAPNVTTEPINALIVTDRPMDNSSVIKPAPDNPPMLNCA